MSDETPTERQERMALMDIYANASRCLRRHLVADRKGIAWAAKGFERAYNARIRRLAGNREI